MNTWPHTILGQQQERTIVFLHGFLGSKQDWSEVAEKLSEEFRCVLVDLPGHGENSLQPLETEKSFNDLVRELAEFVRVVAGEGALVVAYSLGGRLAIAAGIHYSRLFSKLALVSTTPGVASEKERKARREHDALLARKMEEEGMKSFLEFWYSLSVFSSLERKPELRGALISSRARLKPAHAAQTLRAFGPGEQESYWQRLKNLDASVLLLTGAEDLKFVELAKRMKNEIGERAEMQEIEDASHLVFKEQPEALSQSLRAFFG